MGKVPKAVQEMAALLGPKIIDAYQFAEEVHHNEIRGSGAPYITHPVAVAKILFDAGADQDIVIAALLHDVLESHAGNTRIQDQIYFAFGDQVLYLVEAVSKDDSIIDKTTQQAEYMKQMERSFEVDIFVFTIKIADLIHNLSTIAGLPDKRRHRWIHELHEQYFPTFTSFFHRVPLGQRRLFMTLMDLLQKELGKLEELHKSAVSE